jgi:hypothetical protein
LLFIFNVEQYVTERVYPHLVNQLCRCPPCTVVVGNQEDLLISHGLVWYYASWRCHHPALAPKQPSLHSVGACSCARARGAGLDLFPHLLLPGRERLSRPVARGSAGHLEMNLRICTGNRGTSKQLRIAKPYYAKSSQTMYATPSPTKTNNHASKQVASNQAAQKPAGAAELHVTGLGAGVDVLGCW